MGFFAFVGFIVTAVLMVMIFRKAGYSGMQLILCFVPGVNFIVFIWFAITEWPIQRELRELRSFNVTPGDRSSA